MTDQQTDLTLHYYLVAFLDVLGQRENLRQIQHLPHTASEYSETVKLLQNTVGVVLGLRRTFRQYFDAFGRLRLPDSGGDVALRNEIERAMQSSVEIRVFSDSFVISVPLRSDEEPVAPAIGIYSALISACFVMIVALKGAHPIRGGIDVGLAMNISPGEIYGPALERAHFLESSFAKHPRILIGDELWQYLTLGENTQATTPSGRIVRKLTQMSKDLVVTDSDGLRILDYLGPNFLRQSAQNFANDLVRPAYEFVVQQHELWRSAENEKLSVRYGNVRQYFESRLPSVELTC